MNSISISGILGKDAELRALADGTKVAAFSVADSQGKEKPTIWWNCQMFGKRAESLQQYLTKGSHVTVVGSVSEREWQDRDGTPRKSMDVRVNDITLQGGRKEASEPRQAPTPAPRPAAKRTAPSSAAGSGFDDMQDDSIPF